MAPSAARAAIERHGALIATVDPARSGSYENRVFGLSSTSLTHLDDALGRFEPAGLRLGTVHTIWCRTEATASS